MKSADPLLAAWDQTLLRKNDQPAIFSAAGEVLRTFRAIEEQARAFSKIDIFQAAKVLAVQIGNHEDWPSIVIASLRKQVVILPLEQSISNQQRDAAMQVCGASGLVSVGQSGDSPVFEKCSVPKPAHVSGALLKLTSGTTDLPRAIQFRSEQLLADCNQICETMGISDADLNFGVIPISHSYGFSNLLTPLIARGVPVVLSRDRVPRAVLSDLARTHATVFPGMPLFYQSFCEMETVPLLPKLRLCISAGAPLSLSIAKKFREKFRLPIHSFYGASECGGICYDSEAADETEGFVGQPMKGVDVDIVDPAAASSQIRVHSAAVGTDYFPEADEEKLGNGSFLPDDLLEYTASGFKIVGRNSDVINVAGKKLNPAEVEAQLLRFAGVRQAVVFGRQSAFRNEEVTACIVPNVDPATGQATKLEESDLLEFCRAHLSGWQTPKRIFIVNEIPTTERGKISRRELARRFPA